MEYLLLNYSLNSCKFSMGYRVGACIGSVMQMILILTRRGLWSTAAPDAWSCPNADASSAGMLCRGLVPDWEGAMDKVHVMLPRTQLVSIVALDNASIKQRPGVG